MDRRDRSTVEIMEMVRGREHMSPSGEAEVAGIVAGLDLRGP